MPTIPHFTTDLIAQPARGRVEAAQIVPRALAGLGQEIERFGRLRAETEILKNEALNQTEASNLLFAAEAEAEDRKLRLEQTPDPRTHSANLLGAIQEIGTGVLSRATNESVRQLLEPRLMQLTGRFYRESRQTENRWLIEQSKATLLQSGAILEQRAIRAVDSRDRDAALAELNREWDARFGVLGADAIAKGKMDARRRVRMGVLNRLAFDDPDAAEKELAGPEFSDLTEQERLQLDLNVERRKRQIVADRERAEARAEKIFKEERENRVREDVMLARDGKLTQRELDERARLFQYQREDYDRIRDHLEKGPTVASNPDTLKRMTLEVRTRPREGLKGELAALYRGNILNRVDYQQLDDELQQLLTSGSERSDLRFRHAQAEQLIRTAYGADNPFFRRLQGAEIDTAIALAYRDLTAASSAFGGGTDPLEAAKRIIPRYLSHIPGAMEARIKVELGQLPYKTIQELGSKEQARAKGLTEEQWKAIARKLREVEQLQQALAAYRATRAPKQERP